MGTGVTNYFVVVHESTEKVILVINCPDGYETDHFLGKKWEKKIREVSIQYPYPPYDHIFSRVRDLPELRSNLLPSSYLGWEEAKMETLSEDGNWT